MASVLAAMKSVVCDPPVRVAPERSMGLLTNSLKVLVAAEKLRVPLPEPKSTVPFGTKPLVMEKFPPRKW